MYDVITVGSSLVDIFVESKGFEIQKTTEGVQLCQRYGDKLEIDRFLVTSGGGGSNTAVGFARLGFTTAVVTETGKDDWSEIVLRDFHKEKVATNLVVLEKKEATGGSIILVGTDGGRTVLVHRGASSMLDPKDLPRASLERCRWVHVSSISGKLDTLKLLFAILAKKSQRALSWNPGKRELALLETQQLSIKSIPCEIFIVNAQEWQLLSSVQDQIRAQVPQIIITKGSKGFETICDGRRQVYEHDAVKSVDDTGAGDAFAVGYVAAQLRGELPETAVRWAQHNAQQVVKHMGAKAGLLRLDALEKQVAKN